MNIFRSIREKGFRTCIAIAFERCIPSWLLCMRRFNVYEMNPQSFGQQKDVIVHWSTSEEQLLAAEELTGPQRSVVDFGAEHMRVCQATIDNQLVGAIWATTDTFVESGLTIRYELAEDQVWLFGAYVDKPFRRSGVYQSILDFCLPDLKSQGKDQILLAVNPDNVASKNVHEKYARRKLGSATALRFLTIAFCFVRGEMTSNRSFTWNHRTQPIAIRFEKTLHVQDKESQ